MIHKPYLLVELGILDGYSTLHIAQGLKENNTSSEFYAYDLFDDYNFKHGNKEEVEKLMMSNGVDEYVSILYGDAYKVYKEFNDFTIDFLHIDISNTGDVLKELLRLWTIKMSDRGYILFEGGSEERDNVEWMRKFNKPPIKKELESNSIIKEFYHYRTYTEFPSLTILQRNGREYQEPSECFYGKGW